jgi:hypothetical protein
MQYDLKPYAGKYVTIKFSAEVKRENAGGALVMQLNDGDTYPEVGGVFHDVTPGTWLKMTGVWAGWLLNDSPNLYLNSWSPSAENAVYEVRDLSVEVNPLNLDSKDMLLDRTGYAVYLAHKKSNEKLIKERIGLLDRFNAIIIINKITKLDDVTDAEIEELKRPWNISGRANFLHNITKFLNDYAAFIKKDNPAQLPLANFIENYYKRGFIAHAKYAAEGHRKHILPLPAEIEVNPEYLRSMDNAAFADAFRELHAFVIRCYEDIERAPLAWGYPDYETTDGYYNRVMDVLFALGLYGVYENGVITIDGAAFFASNTIKRHKKIELMIKGFEQMGLSFEGFGKKAQSFRAEYPDNKEVMAVLCVYTNLIDTTKQDWQRYHLNSLSHRYIEKPGKYPALWHYQMDYATNELREVQMWLFDEAAKYGFSVTGFNKGCISYTKGSKEFLLVRNGGRPPGTNHFENEGKQIGTKVSFIHAFERDPEGMQKLCDRFPDVFRLDDPGRCCGDKSDMPHQFTDHSEDDGKRCSFVMKFKFNGVSYKRCGLGNFFFTDITLDDVKAILEMFLVENKIKA